jgi:hypothetical protein
VNAAGQFIQWQDLFVLLDDGSLPATHYMTFESKIREQAKPFPKGVGVLTILTPETRPPPEDVKRAVKNTLIRLAPVISCLGYAIEPTGFVGVMARATLVGMKIFSSRPYPIYVELSLPQVLGKMLAHMAGRDMNSVEGLMKVITEARAGWGAPVPVRPNNNQLSLK